MRRVKHNLAEIVCGSCVHVYAICYTTMACFS